MSIDDLYGERAYLRGKINACEIKINELDKLIKRLKKEILELEDDIKILTEIDNKTDNVIKHIKHSFAYTKATQTSVSEYYNDCTHTSDWLSRITRVNNISKSYKDFFVKVLLKIANVIVQLEKEIQKKLKSIEEYEKSIEKTNNEKSDAEADLRRVQYEIDNYDDEE